MSTIFFFPKLRRYVTKEAMSLASFARLEYPKPVYELRMRNSQSE
jgi:hypothetical protein